MAEGKKSFLIYCDIINTIDHLTNEEKGILFQHLLEYVNDMNPVLEDRVLLSVWKPIKNQLKRDLEKYKERSITNRENALKRWNTKNATACDGMQTDAKHADNVNVNDNVNVDSINTTILNERDFKRYDGYIKQLSTEQMKIDSIYLTYKLKKGSLTELTQLFIAHLKLYPEKHITYHAFTKHFFGWMGLQDRNGKLNNFKERVKGSL